MKQKAFFSGLSMLISAIPLLGGNAFEFGFENAGDFKPGYYNEQYVNPTGDCKINTAAHSGSSAVMLNDSGAIIIDCNGITTGKDYRLTAWVKGKGNAFMQIEWLGTKENSYKQQPLTDKYQRIIIDATAPAGCKHIYLKFRPEKGGQMWLDDIQLAERVIDPAAALLDFETPLTSAGNVGKHYVNPTGEFTYDDTAKNARNGIGAMKLGTKGRITVAYTKVIPGKTYELSAWVKGKGNAGIQLQWLGNLPKPQLDTKGIELKDEYQLIKQRAVAPKESNGMIYLHIFSSGDSPEMWVDDVRFEEVKKEAEVPAITATFTGSHERFSVYQPGEDVVLRVTGNALITAPDTLEWRLCDYRNTPVDQGSLAVTPQQLQNGVELKYAPKKSGAYFLYLKLAKSGATIPFKGSRHPGFVSFGVLPSINPLPLKSPEYSRFGGQGTNFILSGEFMKGRSLDPFYPTVGMRWSYYGTIRFSELETAPGVFKAKSADDYRKQNGVESADLNMMELNCLEGAPQYMLKLPPYMDKNAKIKGMDFQSYPLADRDAYYKLFSEAVKDRAARSSVLFPNVDHNYYQIHWEPDWHWQGTEDDFIEYYHLAAKAIRDNDPKGILMGANYGVISSGTDKMASLFKKGLGNDIGGVLSHLYFLPVKSEPEQAGLDRDCRRLRRLTDKYIRPGAPLMNTEWGVDYRGQDTGAVGHAEWMNQLCRFIRGHVIALGEGFDATWFFYTTDYCDYNSNGGEQGYGISFNTSSYIDKYKFGAASLEPKPTMMAAAAMTRLLEGTKTLGRLDNLPADIFAYSFRRGDRNLLAVWNPERTMTMKLPVGIDTVTVFDIMGNPREVNCPDGMLELQLDNYPQYVLGIADRVLPTAPRNANSIFKKSFEITAPGSSLEKLMYRRTPGKLELRRPGFSKTLDTPSIPDEIAVGGYELAALDNAGKTVECMLLEIAGAVSFTEIKTQLNRKNELIFNAGIANASGKKQELKLTCFYDNKPIYSTEVKLAPESVKNIEIPAAALSYDSLAPKKLRFELTGPAGKQAEYECKFAVAQAPATPKTPVIDGQLGDWTTANWSQIYGKEAVTYQIKRHRDNRDFSLRYALCADNNKLYLAFEVNDDAACASNDPAKPWLGDAVALVLGRDFDGREEFKSCTYLTFSRNADGKVLIRQILGVPPKGCIEIAPGEIDCAIRRDDAAGKTFYEIAIPRKMFSEKTEPIGLGISVYDADSENEVKEDVHRDIPLLGGVPLFMGNKTFATFLFGK